MFSKTCHPKIFATYACCAVLVSAWASTLASQEPNAEWLWHGRWVTSIAKGGNDSFYAGLATGLPFREATVVKFSGANPDEAQELYKHPAAVWAVATSPDGNHLASTDYQGTLAVRNIASSETKHFDKAFGSWTRTIVFGKDSKILAAGNEAGKLFAWNISEQKVLHDRDLKSGQIISMSMSPSGSILAATTGSGKVHFVAWPSLEPVKEVQAGTRPLWSIAFGASDDVVWVGAEDGLVRQIPKEGEPIEVGKLNGIVTAMTALPAGGLAAVSMRGQVMRSGDAQPKSLTEWMPKASDGVWDIKAMDNDRLLIATRKLGPAVLRSVGSVQYEAKDAATKAADRKAAAERAAEELAKAKALAEQKAAEEKAAMEKKAAEEKAAAEKAASEKEKAEKAAAEKKAAEEKAAAEKKPSEEKKEDKK